MTKTQTKSNQGFFRELASRGKKTSPSVPKQDWKTGHSGAPKSDQKKETQAEKNFKTRVTKQTEVKAQNSGVDEHKSYRKEIRE